ncbi:MAG: radical SAM family heme chaperone HemW [Endomicrobium sp.]|jgi:oxygen-independent coproporphyrinogen-3 oxidase|nr:radical SAM family heme chaperone HemW [Endomicrobium sp.]
MANVSLYVHIPFCYSKCFYCGFFSIKYSQLIVDEYITALIKEMQHFQEQSIHSVYIGGGTPSILSIKQMQRLLNAIGKFFNLNKLQEFTFEVNPDSISIDKLKLLKSFCVNRLSIGLQSINDKLLTYLGRTYNFQLFLKIYEAARKEAFNNINIDLIYGFPKHIMNDWIQTLSTVLSLNSEHLSLYPMSIEMNTVFYKKHFNIDNKLQRKMYDIAVKMLNYNKYVHYEISSWEKRNNKSIHNVSYWNNCEYIGIGAGACGYINHIRYKNIDNVPKYISLIKTNNINVKIEHEKINKATHILESILLGLRLLENGVNIKFFKLYKQHYLALKKCLNNKTLINNAGKIKLNPKYIFVSNQILKEFV